MPKVSFDPHAPRTNAILGALLSGGDPLKMARLFIESDAERQTLPEPARATQPPRGPVHAAHSRRNGSSSPGQE
jgi:hypothetical protein